MSAAAFIVEAPAGAYAYAEIEPGKWEVWNRFTRIKHVAYGPRTVVEQSVAKLERAWEARGRDTFGGGWKEQRDKNVNRLGRPRTRPAPTTEDNASLAPDDLRRFVPELAPPTAPAKKPVAVEAVAQEPKHEDESQQQPKEDREEEGDDMPRTITDQALDAWEALVKGGNKQPSVNEVVERAGLRDDAPTKSAARGALRRNGHEPRTIRGVGGGAGKPPPRPKAPREKASAPATNGHRAPAAVTPDGDWPPLVAQLRAHRSQLVAQTQAIDTLLASMGAPP